MKLSRQVLSLALIASIAVVVNCNRNTKPADGVISVNGSWIKKSEIEYLAEFIQRDITRMYPQKALSGVSPEIRKGAAQQLIANELFLQEATKQHRTIDTAKVNASYEEMYKRFPDEATFQSELTRSGQTKDGLRDQIKKGMMLEGFMKDFMAQHPDSVSDAECKAFYDANSDKFISQGKVKAQQILLLFKKDAQAADAQKAALKEKAQKILAEVKSGKDFSGLAKKYSEDPNAAEGGDIGWFKKGDLLPEIENAVFMLKKNGVSDIVESPLGFHIIKKTDEKEPEKAVYAEVVNEIRQNLNMKKRNDNIKNYFDGLLKNAKVVYVDTIYKQ